MKIEHLSNNLVYTKGSDIWFAANKEASSWTLKLDWYVNFLIAKAQKKEKQDISLQLKKIIQEEELEIFEHKKSKKNHLLIASEFFLPSKALIIIKYDANKPEKWLEDIKQNWIDLNQPKLRIFLPRNFNKDLFNEYSKKNFTSDLTYVSEDTYYN